MSLLLAQRARGFSSTFQILDSCGDAVTPGANDVVRVRLQQGDATAVLEVTSEAATAAGSSVTKGATCTLRLDATDLTLPPGVYTLRIDYMDNADAQEWKSVDRHTFVIEGT